MARAPKEDVMAKDKVDQDLIRELAKLLDETGLTEIEFEQSGRRVRVARQSHQTMIAAPARGAAPAAGEAAPAAGAAVADPAKHPGVVASPMVGTAYMSPEPGAKPFVEIGTRVTAGQTLIIIEAMKTMNQIPAPRAGTVIQILIEDGQPIEFGEPLLILE